MISSPAGWTQHFGAHLVTLYPPEGGGRIRFYERLRPVRTTSQVVGFALDKDPAFRVSSVLDPIEVTTCEGEYGVWVRVNGTREGAPAVHLVGAVFTDEFAAALDTLVVLRDKLPMLERISRQLLGELTLGLGVRRRRFRYDPPVAWQAIPSGLVANWYPPDFPANNTNIVVHPADPAPDVAPTIEAYLSGESARGFSLQTTVDELAIESQAGMVGTLWRFAGRRPNRDDLLYRDVVRFYAAPYVYSMRMETYDAGRVDEHRALFEAVARSARPLPTAGHYRFGAAVPRDKVDTFVHWVD